MSETARQLILVMEDIALTWSDEEFFAMTKFWGFKDEEVMEAISGKKKESRQTSAI